jgi:hypothetical protein
MVVDEGETEIADPEGPHLPDAGYDDGPVASRDFIAD